MQTVIQTPTFLADAKAAGVEDDERDAIVAVVAADPQAGDMTQAPAGPGR